MVSGMKDRILRAKLRTADGIASFRIGPVPAGNLMCRLVTSTNRSVGPQPHVSIPLPFTILKICGKTNAVFSAFTPSFSCEGAKGGKY